MFAAYCSMYEGRQRDPVSRRKEMKERKERRRRIKYKQVERERRDTRGVQYACLAVASQASALAS